MHSIAVCLFVVAAPAVATLAQERPPEHLLRVSFQVGRSEFREQTMQMRMTMKMGEKRVDKDIQCVLHMEQHVDSWKDGKAIVASTLRRVVYEMSGPPKIRYDSSDPNSKPVLIKDLADLVGKTIHLSINDHGRLTSVQLPEDWEPRSMPFDLEQMFSAGMPGFPDAPVAIGDTWETETEMQLGSLGSEKVKTINTLTKVEGGRASIAQKFEIDTENLRVQGNPQMRLAAHGTTLIDLATGSTLETTVETVMTSDAFDMTTTTTVRAVAAPSAANDGKAAADK